MGSWGKESGRRKLRLSWYRKNKEIKNEKRREKRVALVSLD